MKNHSLPIIGVLVLAMLSCQQEEIKINNGTITVQATQVSYPLLKTNIGGPGDLAVTWNANDKLALFDGTADNKNVPFLLSGGANTKSASFTGTISNWPSGQKTFYAVYPYDAANSSSTYTSYTITVPQIQTQDFTSDNTKYVHLGLNDKMAAPSVMVEKTGETQPDINFSFQHLMAILDIEVTNNTGGSIRVLQIRMKRTGQDFTLTANLDLTKTIGTSGFLTQGTMTDQLVLQTSNTSQIANSTTFTGSMVIAPVDLTSGNTLFEVSVLDADNQGKLYSAIKSSGKNLEAGMRYKAQITINAQTVLADVRDGKSYKTIGIGTQTWMAENLAYLPSVSPSTLGSPGLFYYVYGYEGSNVSDAKATANYNTYGALYDFEAALVGCPSGWHLPSDAEWTALTDFIGSPAGGKMKETGTSHWVSPNTGASNSSGFTTLPSGYRAEGSGFYRLGFETQIWSATNYLYAYLTWIYRMFNDEDGVTRQYTWGDYGFPVRCIKD